jgi:16S rRNA (cytosine967-C5)-methyltransferase
MAQRSARQTALAALLLWRKEKRFADAIISGLLAKANLAASDRAFALDLFYGVLRNLTLLGFLDRLSARSRIESDVRDTPATRLVSSFLLKTPEHAAVTRDRCHSPQKQRPIINAVLRAATRQHNELLAQADAQPLFVRTSHPQFLVERWQQRFGAEYTEELCKWNNRPAPIYGRINRLKSIGKPFYSCTQTHDRYCESRFCRILHFATAALDSGHCYIQDPSTAIACQLLDPKPGERILDACAAPGGKTAYLAQFMENRGAIIACERDRERLQILENNVGRLGASIVRAVRHDWTLNSPPEEILATAPFDRVLLDAPCTNTGSDAPTNRREMAAPT